jgi:hypothetical protein
MRIAGIAGPAHSVAFIERRYSARRRRMPEIAPVRHFSRLAPRIAVPKSGLEPLHPLHAETSDQRMFAGASKREGWRQ